MIRMLKRFVPSAGTICIDERSTVIDTWCIWVVKPGGIDGKLSGTETIKDKKRRRLK
jgi:hypothetical protein